MGVFSLIKRSFARKDPEPIPAPASPTPVAPPAGRAPAPWTDPVGRALPRREDWRALTGTGRYVGDLKPAGRLYAAFLRSPVARGRIAALDVEAAGAAAGVRLVLTGADLKDDGEGLPVNSVIDGESAPRAPLLADGGVRALGQPVALVVADTPDAAQDAVDAITLEVEPERPILDPETAETGPPVDPSRADNLAGRRVWTTGDVEAALQSAHRVVTVALRHPRLAPSPMEGRASLAEWSEGRLTLWSGQQAPHRARDHLAALLDLPADSVRVIAPDVGGAFGMKASLYPEDVLIAEAARRLERPVKWIASRGEDLLSAGHGRGAHARGRMGFDADGRIVAMAAQFDFPLGYWTPFSGLIPAWNASRILPGPYRIDALTVEARAFATNTGPVGIYRGAGRPEAAMLLERLIEAGSRALGCDPAELRRCNLLQPTDLPYEHGGGARLDSGDYPALLKQTLDAADYAERRRVIAERRAAGECVGLGLALYVEPCGQGWESARLTLGAHGDVTLAFGGSAQGQGRETAAAQIAGHALKLDADRIDVVAGDTQSAPAGVGALASRSTAIGGGAILKAADAFLARARAAAAEILEVPTDALRHDPDGFAAADNPGARVTWSTLAARAPELSVEERYTADGEAWGAGCCLAQVAVDVETGVLTVEDLVYHDDAGVIVNPALAEGQLIGGVAQGLGEAMMEAVRYDEDGQLLTGSLMDYALPRAADMPPIATGRRETPSPANSLGAKGVGEAGTIGAPPAVVNAALDALAPFGVAHLDMPLTAERIWSALKAAQKNKDCG
ncbi:MAG: xanthine dehydrogenase family protein molybdopterin-binding subunit [Marivibrio sp.]|uniref:xanthine dehydrogenase family protein molybdopterin-binding subunit n=1 Tax=Marivibrio sp. TaxID=2039719 RepID=UPI0032EC3D65